MKLRKFISSSLIVGLLFNNISSIASVLSEDGRYETFEGSNITINDILEEDEVDVEIEGNTMVNVANQKDPVPITKSYTVEGTNHIPLQGEYDGKARPVIEGNTMYYNNDTGELTDTFVEGANLSLVSSFEDQLVTPEMVNSGQEEAKNLGKYKVEYKVTGKNKWSFGDLSGDVIFFNNQEPILKKGTTYTVSSKTNTQYDWGQVLRLDNKNNTAIESVNLNFNKTFTLEEDVYRVILYSNGYDYNASIGKPTTFEGIQIEEGSVATEYEPYKESIKTFYLNSPLLEGDTIEDIDGKATHVKRYEKVLLNGSESWALNDSQPNNSNLMCFYIDNIYYLKTELKCNNFIYDNRNITEYTNEGIKVLSGSKMAIAINKSKLLTTNVLGFIEWLQGNPTTVLYELAQPVYETISEESILVDSYTNGHLDLNTNIPVNKANFKPTITNLNYLYPSTEYTVQFESDNIGKIDTVSLASEILHTNYSVNKGINRFNIITPSEITSTELVFDGIGFNLSNLVVTEATDKSFGYFEGIKSVGQDAENKHNIEIKSNSRNLFDKNSVTKGYLLSDIDGSPLEYRNWFYTDYIKVNPGKYYIGYYKEPFDYFYCAFYDINKNYIGSGRNVGIEHRWFELKESGYVRLSGEIEKIDLG